MSLLGFDALGRMALGQIRTAAPSTLVFASMSSAGAAVAAVLSISTSFAAMNASSVGSVALQSASKASSAMSGSGSAAFAPKLQAKVTAVVTAQGNSSMLGSNSPAGLIQFVGFSTMNAVMYAFYTDAEKAGPAFEAKIATAAHENRCAVAPAEDRVYYTKSKPRSLGPPNRRRTL